MPLVRTLLHVLKSYAALALYSMFLLCLRSIWSMFSLYVGGEGRCMTVYMVSPWQRQNWRLAVFWINPSLCSKLYWQFPFQKLLHTSSFCLMVNSLNNSLIVWIQVWYICFTYSCSIKFCRENSVHVRNNCTPMYFVFRSVYSSSSSCWEAF